MPARLRPSPALLTRFFQERHPRPVEEVAALVGWPREQVEREARNSNALLPGGFVEWYDAASWVLEAWPLATLFRQLGPQAALLPSGLQLIPLRLEQPAFLVRALQTQQRIEPMPHRTVRPRTFSEYMTDLLYRSIHPDTVDALSDDEAFLRAYAFPPGEDDDPR
jgi:hypothetical protein